MATVDLATLGARIAQARSRAGLSQAALADEVALDRSALAKVEGGSRRVTALELSRIADALEERIEWFLREPPPSIVSYRNAVEPGLRSTSMDKAVERITRHAEFLLRHDERLAQLVRQDDRPAPVEMATLARPKTVSDLERVATDVREMLGLRDEDPFLDAAALVTRLGLLPFSLDLGSEAADAASILLPQGGVALVNGGRQVGRRRLALVHELGHYVFADEYSVDWRIAEQTDSSTWEARIDRFARAVLLPAGRVRQAWSEAVATVDEPRQAAVVTASMFRVDMATLARRLTELKVVGRPEASRIREVRTTKADIAELNLLVADELEAPSLALPYKQAVLRLYRGETISAARALDLMLGTWQEDDLPPLPELPQDAIWDLV